MTGADIPADIKPLVTLLPKLENDAHLSARRYLDDFLAAALTAIGRHRNPLRALETLNVRGTLAGALRAPLQTAALRGYDWQRGMIDKQISAQFSQLMTRVRQFEAQPQAEEDLVLRFVDSLFSPPTQAIDRYLAQRVPPLARVEDDLRRKTREIVAGQMRTGANTEALKATLRAQFPGFAEHRITNIARTETMTLFHMGGAEAMWEDPLVEGFELNAVMDDRTCPICGALNGETFAFGSPGAGMYYPPLHCQCRCVPLPLVLPAHLVDAGRVHGSDGSPVFAQKGFGEIPVADLGARMSQDEFYRLIRAELNGSFPGLLESIRAQRGAADAYQPPANDPRSRAASRAQAEREKHGTGPAPRGRRAPAPAKAQSSGPELVNGMPVNEKGIPQVRITALSIRSEGAEVMRPGVNDTGLLSLENGNVGFAKIYRYKEHSGGAEHEVASTVLLRAVGLPAPDACLSDFVFGEGITQNIERGLLQEAIDISQVHPAWQAYDFLGNATAEQLEQVRTLRVMDVAIGNRDRHGNNVWVELTQGGNGRMIPIDNWGSYQCDWIQRFPWPTEDYVGENVAEVLLAKAQQMQGLLEQNLDSIVADCQARGLTKVKARNLVKKAISNLQQIIDREGQIIDASY